MKLPNSIPTGLECHSLDNLKKYLSHPGSSKPKAIHEVILALKHGNEFMTKYLGIYMLRLDNKMVALQELRTLHRIFCS